MKNVAHMDRQEFALINETGNVFIRTSCTNVQRMPAHIEKLFIHATAHFAAITRAITTTRDKKTGKAYRLYHHHALIKVLDHHPCFSKVDEVTTYLHINRHLHIVHTEQDSLLASMGGTAGAKMRSIYRSLFVQAQQLFLTQDDAELRVGHITLCCEDLIGVPVITAVVEHFEIAQFANAHKRRKLNWFGFRRQKILMGKTTYLFQAPKNTGTRTWHFDRND